MSSDVVLPNLGFGMEEGRLVAWLKKPGDQVRKGEPIAEIESDKATVELEAVVDGVLEEILEPADKVVPVGAILARIGSGTAQKQASPGPASSVANAPDPQRITPVARRVAEEHGVNLQGVVGTGPGGRITREDVQGAITQPPQSNGHSRPLAVPAVRKLARDHGLDLATIRGTGKDGHITRADVESILAQPKEAEAVPVKSPVQTPAKTPAAPVAVDESERREIPLTRIRQVIASRLAKSAQEAPHFYVTAELDLTSALETLPKEIGINNLLLYLTVQTLKDMPDLNATYEDGHLYQYSPVNLAIAVALPTGLITPVLHHADDFSLKGLAARARDLISRTRENRLRPEELGGGTFTISNLGMVQQIERFTAIINPPQVAILAIGSAKPRPVVIDGGLHIRTTVYLTVSADHRIIDGLIAARFLEAFDGHLQAFSG